MSMLTESIQKALHQECEVLEKHFEWCFRSLKVAEISGLELAEKVQCPVDQEPDSHRKEPLKPWNGCLRLTGYRKEGILRRLRKAAQRDGYM